MDIFDLMWTRRSIRKYQDRQIPRQALEQVLRAGSWAPNAGGGQRTMLVGLRDRTLPDRLSPGGDRPGDTLPHPTRELPALRRLRRGLPGRSGQAERGRLP